MNPKVDTLASPGLSAFLTQAVQHLQLIAVEWEEEKLRLQQMLVMLLLSISLFICSLLSISTLILVVTWDTQFRIPGICALAVIFTMVTVIVWLRFVALGSESAGSFSDSRRELEADFRLLRNQLER